MTAEERKKTYLCRYCVALVGCSEQGKIGMYSLKILRMHEVKCTKNISFKSAKR